MKKPKRRSVSAAALALPAQRPRIVPSKKTYKRKPRGNRGAISNSI